MRTEAGHDKFAGGVGMQMPWSAFACQRLCVDLFLQGHERIDEGLGAWRTSWDMYVNGNVAVDTLQNVVSLLKGAARDGARAHGDDVLWLRHLVIEAHYLRGHLFGDSTGDDDQVRLTRRRSKNFRAEPRDIVARHTCCDHFDGAARQAKRHGPHGILSAPVVELFEGRYNDPLFAQFDSEFLIHCDPVLSCLFDALHCIFSVVIPRSIHLSAMPIRALRPAGAKRPSWRWRLQGLDRRMQRRKAAGRSLPHRRSEK